MKNVLTPHLLVFAALAGWLNREQQKVLEYLREETRVLREQLGNRRLRLNDDDRRRLAVRGKEIGRRLLDEFATLVTPTRSSAGTANSWPASGPTRPVPVAPAS